MIRLPNGVLLVEREEDLPWPEKITELFKDVETTSNDRKRSGLMPWLGDRICGVAVTWDDHPEVYYVPVRHTDARWNIPLDVFQRWLGHMLSVSEKWINHNIKFDRHFTEAEGTTFTGRMIDTLTLSKMNDTDRTEHGLKALCRDWLNMEMSEEKDLKAYLKRIKSKRYGDVPADFLGAYAGMDVLGNRKLWRYLVESRPTEFYDRLWETEINLTSELWKWEHRGFPVDRQAVKIELVKTLKKIILAETELSLLSEREFSSQSAWIYDLLVNVHGLPILMYNEKTGRPTFNKKAMRLYAAHPKVVTNPTLSRIVELYAEYKKEEQYRALFLVPFLELSVGDGRIHPIYNQLVRTSRMSARGPNIQQQTKRSKALIHPDPGRCFLSSDYSQIEFRLISHYANDLDVIEAYNTDPDTDFHKITAALIYHVEIDKVTKKQRSPAKTMNFMMGFGGGKKKTITSIRTDPGIIEEVTKLLDEQKIEDPIVRAAEFDRLAEVRAAEVYHTYHERMPGIKRISHVATKNCKMRGYVFTAYGRRRHLPNKAVHKAFNSVVQGGAMDIIKERMVACSQDAKLREWDVRIVGNVHDEVLFDAPISLMMNAEVHKHILSILENPRVKFRVPIKAGLGVSAVSWAEAAGDDTIKDEQGNIIAGRIV